MAANASVVHSDNSSGAIRGRLDGLSVLSAELLTQSSLTFRSDGNRLIEYRDQRQWPLASDMNEAEELLCA